MSTDSEGSLQVWLTQTTLPLIQAGHTGYAQLPQTRYIKVPTHNTHHDSQKTTVITDGILLVNQLSIAMTQMESSMGLQDESLADQQALTT